MKVLYVKKISFGEKVSFWKRLFRSITVKEVENRTILILPYGEEKFLNEKNSVKIAKKLCNMLLDKPNVALALPKELMNNKGFINFLNENGCNILTGRWAFSYIINYVLDYIVLKSQKEFATLEISVMVNEVTEKNLKIISEIASKVKMLNIVTNHIEEFTKFEENLYDNYGILIRVTNNTRKALLKTNIIVNLDFTEELVNRYFLPKKAIIVNIENKVNIFSKKFSGININNYNIEFPSSSINFFEENNLLNSFDNTILFESILYAQSTYSSIIKQLKDSNFKVKSLVGVNGEIGDEEFKNC